MRHLFECFGNPKALTRAIERAIPNLEKVREYREQLVRIEAERDKIKLGREKVIRREANGDISEEEATNQLNEFKQKDIKLQAKQQQIKTCIYFEAYILYIYEFVKSPVFTGLQAV